MLSIDEAIAHAREVASEQKRRSGICVQNNSECDKFSACLKCSKEHEQLAEWLEELKVLRHGANELRSAGYEHGYSVGYNKAIDDFVRLANTMPTVEEEDGEIRPMWLEEIAGQLKESEAEWIKQI